MTPPKHSPRDTPAATRRETTALIERAIAVAGFAALLFGVALVLRPFVSGILFGTILVIATWPLRDRLVRSGVSASVTTALLLLAAFVTIGVPAIFLAPELGERLGESSSRALEYFTAMPELPDWVSKIPLVGDRISQARSELAAPGGTLAQVLKPYSAELQKLLIEVARALAQGVFQLFVALAVATMFWLRGDALAGAVKEVTERLGGSVAGAALSAAADSVRGIAYGVVGTAAFQAIAIATGLIIAGVPGSALLGFVALLIALSQFGILLVVIWGGAAWWLYSTGSPGWAIFMIVWGLVVSTVDNIVRPWLVSFGAAMPLTLIFFGVLGGFIAFGFLGLFIGPTLLGVFYTLLQAWRQRPER